MSTLEVQDIVMEFPGIRALDTISLAFEVAEVHGVVGENGAGKSTLMKILGGVQRPTSGTLLIDGIPTVIHNVRDALRHGIAMIHQELNLVDELTVAENVFLGQEITRGGLLDRNRMLQETTGYLKEVHAGFSASAKVGELSIAGKQLVEIAKALALKASILIMDEPTAVLSDPEAESLFELIAKLKANGTTILYISHRLTEVCAICDRVTVLRDGAKIATVLAKGAQPSELAGLMVGRALTDFYPQKSPAPQGEPILEIDGIHGAKVSVRPGEILGLAGLVGAGRTELAEAVFGVRSSPEVVVRVNGKTCQIRSPQEAMRLGIGYVSEDRKSLGLHMNLSVVQNCTLANLRAYGDVVLDQNKESTSAATWKKELDIRVSDLGSEARALSGGNQQKIAIAKWLETKPKVLILDEPTRGVDVGAKRELYTYIQKLAAEGMGCIVISSELAEVIGLCHRVVVLRDGEVAGELLEAELSEESIMRLAAGVAA